MGFLFFWGALYYMIKKFIPMPEIIYTCYPQSEIGGLPLFHKRAAVSCFFVGIQTFGSDTFIFFT